jgi:hypothetical protein
MSAPTSTQATRLADLRRKSGLSRDQVSEKLKTFGSAASRAGVQIKRYEDDETIRIKLPVLVALAKIYRTTPDFIEAGVAIKALAVESTAEILGTKADMPYILLPFVRPAAYATFAANCQDYNPEELERINVLVRTGVDYRQAVVIEVRGNSMAPRYPDRSCYVVRPVSDGNWQYATGVHAISLRSAMFVIKRVTSNKDGVLTLTSDNGGDEITVQLGDILCMWKVGEAAYLPAED